ncbi:MAG TPA: DUF4390 domain-containing protein [Polyangia bacterium]
MTRWAPIVCLGLLAWLDADQALAEPTAVRATGIARKADKVVISVGLQDLFGPRDVERLLSGFSTRVLIRVALVRDGGDEPIAQAMRLAEIVYDLWDEKLRVRFSTGKPGAAETLVVATPKAAVDLATSLVGFPVVESGRLEAGASYHVSLRADLNPISEELVSNLRRWLSHPSGRGRSGSGDSFFGSFVSVFVNPRIDDSERLLQLVSQSFSAPAGASP